MLGIRTPESVTIKRPHMLSAPRPHQSTSDCLSGVKSKESFKVDVSDLPKKNVSFDIDDDCESSSSVEDSFPNRLPWDTRPLARIRGGQRIHEPQAKSVPTGDGKFHVQTLPVRWQVRLNDSKGPKEWSLLDNCSGLSIISEN